MLFIVVVLILIILILGPSFCAILAQKDGPQINTVNIKTTTINKNLEDLWKDQFQQQEKSNYPNP